MSQPISVSRAAGSGGLTELVPDDLTTALHRLTGWALEQHVTLTGLEVIRPSLEDVYLELTGGPAEPAEGMQAGFLGTAFHWTDVLFVAAWGLGGLLLAVRFFSWEPRS